VIEEIKTYTVKLLLFSGAERVQMFLPTRSYYVTS
jgi:hypothetical protein